jgi:hypothetical protein
MIHLKYEYNANFVKLPLIWIYRCLKLIFGNATAGRNTGCCSVVNPTHPAFPARLSYRSSVEITRTLWWQTRFTRGRVREWKSGHNSVTVQNRTRVHMNFFEHKDLGNHPLQLCPKVVKHPVYYHSLCFLLAGLFLDYYSAANGNVGKLSDSAQDRTVHS